MSFSNQDTALVEDDDHSVHTSSGLFNTEMLDQHHRHDTTPPELSSIGEYTNKSNLKSQHNHQHAVMNSPDAGPSTTGTPAMPVLSKHADQAIAPFYAQHIPSQYNPVGVAQDQARINSHVASPSHDTANTKYCNRHRPDLKCRRQVNEPSMDELQAELSDMASSDQQAITQIWSIFSAAPAKHRNMILRGLLTQCCFPQLSFLSNQVRELVKIDFISALPAELSYKILCSLDTTSLCKAAQVSRKWRQLADDDIVWHRMCEQHIDRKCTKCGWGLPLLDKRRLRLEKTLMELKAKGATQPDSPTTGLAADSSVSSSNNTSAAPQPSESEPANVVEDKDFVAIGIPAGPSLPHHHDNLDGLDLATRKRARTGDDDRSPRCKRSKPGQRPWKDVYRDRFKVGTNWKYGRCSIKTFKGHSNGVMCLQFDDSMLATGSYDATIRLWDIESGKLIRELKGHTSGVRCLQFDAATLMSGSLDGTLRVWNWRTGLCTRVLNAHRGGVISLHFTLKMIATGSTDKTIKVFDMRQQPNPITFRLRGHADWVNSIKIDQDSATLFSCSDDFTVRLWDLETRQCIRCYEGHVGQVQQVLPMPREFEPFDEREHATGRENNNNKEPVSSGASTPVAQHTTYRAPAYPGDTGAYDHHPPVPPFWKDSPERRAPPRYMITGALDSTIRLWDVHADSKLVPVPCYPSSTGPDGNSTGTQLIPTVFNHLRTFFGHVEGIWSLAVDHLRLVSGSEDRMVKVWDPRTGKCERTWTGHVGPVTCVGISDSRLVSGSEDCEVRMLEFGYDCEGASPQPTPGCKEMGSV